jgi:hypothetical protein
MYSSDKRGIPQGNAAIVAALIGAAAVIIAAIIPVAAALFFGVVQISFPSSRTPTQAVTNDVAPPMAVAQPLPQPTYTRLPTYTPYPTHTPPRTIVAPKPTTVIPTSSADQQNPSAGSTIAAGRSYTRNNISITVLNDVSAEDDLIAVRIVIKNESGRNQIVVWKKSFMHLRDDKGRVYRRYDEGKPVMDENIQTTIRDGTSWTIEYYVGWYTFPYYPFRGPIDPSATYFIITVDQILGMTNMNWQYNLH